MKLTLKRIALKPAYTIGHLYIDGQKVCDTIEDTVRDLNKNGVFDNGEKKVYAETAIPYGAVQVLRRILAETACRSPFRRHPNPHREHGKGQRRMHLGRRKQRGRQGTELDGHVP